MYGRFLFCCGIVMTGNGRCAKTLLGNLVIQPSHATGPCTACHVVDGVLWAAKTLDPTLAPQATKLDYNHSTWIDLLIDPVDMG